MPRWLADLGRPGPALTAIEDAVRVYRDLAQARPDAFLPRPSDSKVLSAHHFVTRRGRGDVRFGSPTCKLQALHTA